MPTTIQPPPATPLPGLPPGIRSRFVDGVNGLRVHLLEAGYETPDRPCVLLLHGFPELAYSWRKVMPALADAGWHVVAPDQRGYGRTTGWDRSYDGDLASFRLLNLVRDALGLVHALGRTHVEAVVGHDFGSPVAAWCALVRPDVFRSVVLMSAPFSGPPALPVGGLASAPAPGAPTGVSGGTDDARRAIEGLAALPRPRKHYQWYYSTPSADTDMRHAPQGLQAFLRAYYHVKSADWPGNVPHALAGWSSEELAKMPTYYIMDRDADMAATVAPYMPTAQQVAACGWLPDAELAVYAAEYRRTGFQGGLQWYRCGTSGHFVAEQQLFAGRTIDVPSAFVAGASDWGVHQKPGEFDRMRERACTRMAGCHLVDGAGHWVQQEQPEATARLLLDFLAAARSA
jgi:pimeloyl-ACP methyl ester carboxylesterase